MAREGDRVLLNLVLKAGLAITLVGFGLYGLRKTGVATFGPLQADRRTNRAGFLAMMFIYACASLFAIIVGLRAAAILFPD